MKLLRIATFSCLVAALLALGLSRTASAADIITYAATAEGDFGTLDLTTGQYSSIGPSGVVSIVGMGFIGNTLYAVDNNNSAPTFGAGFYSINTATGAANPIATLMDVTGAPVTALGGTTVNGLFYGVTQDTPTRLFGANTAGHVLGYNTNPTFMGDGLVALGPGGGPGNLYVSEYTGNPFTGDELHTIAVNGSVSDVGPLNDGMGNGQQAITGLIFGSTLYAIDGTNIYTYTVSPSSVSSLLTTTAISGLNPNGDFVTAVAAVPEPASLIIGSIAIGLAGLVYARRRYRPDN